MFVSDDGSVKAILGYQPQELLGKSVYDFYHTEDQLQMKETFEQGQIFYHFYYALKFVIRPGADLILRPDLSLLSR